MNQQATTGNRAPRWRSLPRNVWATAACSFLNDVSSEMLLNVLPLFLANVLGVRTALIGLIEGVAEATASLLKAPAGVLSDRLRRRKGPAVAGYGLSVLARPLLLLASSWGGVAAARWLDRVGKGVRTAPRDALIADSVGADQRGLAFGVHRGADTAGAALGLLIAIAIVAGVQGSAELLGLGAFRTLVLVSLVPAVAGVVVLGVFAAEPLGLAEPKGLAASAGIAGAAEPGPARRRPRASLRALGRPFGLFLAISALFDLGNSSDAFLILRAQERGIGVVGILWLLLLFNVVYAVVSTPAGALSDRVGRKPMLAAGWLLYAVVYGGFGLAGGAREIGVLWVLYGLYYALTMGTAKALIADLVPAELRASAFGTYFAVLGLIDLPASLIAGVLWQGVGGWRGLGAPAPFVFGAGTALAATIWLLLALREQRE